MVMEVVEDGNEGLNEEQRDYRSNWKYSMIESVSKEFAVDLRPRSRPQIVVECVCARIGRESGRERVQNESPNMMERLGVFCLVEHSPSTNPLGIGEIFLL